LAFAGLSRRRSLPIHGLAERIGQRVPHSVANALFLLRGAPGGYFQDGLFTAHDSPFRRDATFREAYRLGHGTGSFGSWEVEWRTYVCCWAARRALELPGDLVECGVNRGGYSRAVVHYTDLEQTDKTLWLLDTFAGLVDDQISTEERRRGLAAETYADCYDAVRQTFAPFANVNIIRGVVPDTLPQVTAEQVSYLSIDMNCAAPEIAAAEHFWPRLASGATIVIDDYGWRRYVTQREAFDAFALEHGVPILPLPTGQGLIVKP
jgi:hypothetical protein